MFWTGLRKSNLLKGLPGLVLAVALLEPAAAHEYRLKFEATFERVSGVSGASGGAAPDNLSKGARASGHIHFQPAEPMGRPPTMVPHGQGWDMAVKSIKLHAPLNIQMAAGLVSFSDGLLSIVHDPLDNREYKLRALLKTTGDKLAVNGVMYEPTVLRLFQRGHSDSARSLQDVVREAADLGSARMMLTYRRVDTNDESVSLIFNVSELQFVEISEKQLKSH